MLTHSKRRLKPGYCFLLITENNTDLHKSLYFLRLLASFSASEKLAFLFFAFISLKTFITSRFQLDSLRVPFLFEERRVFAILYLWHRISSYWFYEFYAKKFFGRLAPCIHESLLFFRTSLEIKG